MERKEEIRMELQQFGIPEVFLNEITKEIIEQAGCYECCKNDRDILKKSNKKDRELLKKFKSRGGYPEMVNKVIFFLVNQLRFHYRFTDDRIKYDGLTEYSATKKVAEFLDLALPEEVKKIIFWNKKRKAAKRSNFSLRQNLYYGAVKISPKRLYEDLDLPKRENLHDAIISRYKRIKEKLIKNSDDEEIEAKEMAAKFKSFLFQQNRAE